MLDKYLCRTLELIQSTRLKFYIGIRLRFNVVYKMCLKFQKQFD